MSIPAERHLPHRAWGGLQGIAQPDGGSREAAARAGGGVVGGEGTERGVENGAAVALHAAAALLAHVASKLGVRRHHLRRAHCALLHASVLGLRLGPAAKASAVVVLVTHAN